MRNMKFDQFEKFKRPPESLLRELSLDDIIDPWEAVNEPGISPDY